ncbi:MAG TPA: response regulator, partial [Acetobacteraceae bacterium]
MSKPKLLIVEDDEGLCSQYRWAFPEYDLRITHARPQGMAMALKEQPSAAIIDLGLPPDPDGVSEGFAALEGLTRQNPDMKVIVATSHGDREHALRAINGGAYDFCEKPMDIDLLRSIVARA